MYLEIVTVEKLQINLVNTSELYYDDKVGDPEMKHHPDQVGVERNNLAYVEVTRPGLHIMDESYNVISLGFIYKQKIGCN